MTVLDAYAVLAYLRGETAAEDFALLCRRFPRRSACSRVVCGHGTTTVDGCQSAWPIA
jgi:hypothetical protein